MPVSRWRGSFVAFCLLAVLALSTALTQQAVALNAFIDKQTGLTVTKPEGWFMETGQALVERAREEARRLGDPHLGPPPAGAPFELMARMTRYPPGQAPEPNPTVGIMRFDLQRFPPGTSADVLLRMGVGTAQLEEGPTTIELGNRPWRKATARRTLTAANGQKVEVVQQVYVTATQRWAIGLTISALRDQYARYQSAFDAILRSIRFD